MKQILMSLLLAICLPALAEDISYQVREGDSLTTILRGLGYAESYAELLPLINRTVELNPSLFPGANANVLFPGSVILLPPNPNAPESVPEPPPEPEPEPEPIPEPPPEPEIPVIGNLRVSSGLTAIQRSGESVEISDQAEIFANDLVTTRSATLAEITLLDDTRISMGSNSEVIVTEYSFTVTENQDSSALGTLVASIRNGAVRMISGLIGKSLENRYEVSSTLSATIGIRGTDFTVRSCNDREACGDYYGVAVAVQDGKIGFKNDAAEIELNQNEFAQVQSSAEVAEKGPIPEGFLDLERDVSEIESPKSWWQKSVDFLEALF